MRVLRLLQRVTGVAAMLYGFCHFLRDEAEIKKRRVQGRVLFFPSPLVRLVGLPYGFLVSFVLQFSRRERGETYRVLQYCFRLSAGVVFTRLSWGLLFLVYRRVVGTSS